MDTDPESIGSTPKSGSLLSLKEDENENEEENYGKQWEDEGGGGKDTWAPEVAEGTTSTVEISISCRDLDDRDTFSKSDPMCIVSRKRPGGHKWIDFMRTEVIENDLNPDFAEKVLIDYYFDRVQLLRFHVHDIDSPKQKLGNDSSLGYADVLLSQIVQAGSAGWTVELGGARTRTKNDPATTTSTSSGKTPTLILVAEEMASEKGKVVLKLGATSIGSFALGCWPPKSLLVISKMMYSDEKFLVVHRSRWRRGRNVTWPTLNVSCRALCNGNFDRLLRIEIFQKQFGSGYLIPCGCTLTTLAKLMGIGSKERIPLLTTLGQDTKSFVSVISCSMVPMHTFIDYISSPMQIHCCFAIDFTCSNGHPEDVESLHYLSQKPNSPNQYEQAISAVGNIFKDYNTSSQFPTFGFGARLPPYGDISYNFNVNLTDSPDCSGITGVLEAYRECLGKIQLYAPTYFTPIIKTIVNMAKKSRYGDNYYILIILTDGVITDFELTKKTIVEASSLPLSIVIIGIGEMDFESMEELDGDSVGLAYKGKKARRDIVQFVAYRSARAWLNNTGEDTLTTDEQQQHKTKVQKIFQSQDSNDKMSDKGDGDRSSASASASPATSGMDVFMAKNEDKLDRAQRVLLQSQLAQEILAEFPEQVTSYMRVRRIAPDMIKQTSKIAAISKAAMMFKRKQPGGGGGKKK